MLKHIYQYAYKLVSTYAIMWISARSSPTNVYTIGVTSDVPNPNTEKQTINKVKLGANPQQNTDIRFMINPQTQTFISSNSLFHYF